MVCLHPYIYIYMHKHAYIHAYIHTYIHMAWSPNCRLCNMSDSISRSTAGASSNIPCLTCISAKYNKYAYMHAYIHTYGIIDKDEPALCRITMASFFSRSESKMMHSKFYLSSYLSTAQTIYTYVLSTYIHTYTYIHL